MEMLLKFVVNNTCKHFNAQVSLRNDGIHEKHSEGQEAPYSWQQVLFIP
jgi:hypothetical protein